MPLLAGLGPLGVPELLIIAFIVILVFGVGRLPEVGGALGKGIREFRKSTKDDEEASVAASASGDAGATTMSSVATEPTGAESLFCGECGTSNARGNKFCSACGHAIGAAVG